MQSKPLCPPNNLCLDYLSTCCVFTWTRKSRANESIMLKELVAACCCFLQILVYLCFVFKFFCFFCLFFPPSEAMKLSLGNLGYSIVFSSCETTTKAHFTKGWLFCLFVSLFFYVKVSVSVSIICLWLYLSVCQSI